MYNIGDLIDNRYEVLDELGGGGFGQVIGVKDMQTDDKCALKYCFSDKEEDIRRFKREVRIMENIEHENVISILSSNIEHNPPYFTMPMAIQSATELIPIIKDDINEVIKVFEAVCNGINAIHNSGYTHRDIKPDNVLVYNDKIVVSDLGLAKIDERDTTVLTRASVYIGTTDYMPPEQFIYAGTRDLDHRGDIFQIGKTLYQLLSGLRPTVMNPDAVPIGLWYVIQKATRQNPDDRYQSVGRLLDAVYDARRASDPSLNPKAVFDELLIIAEEKLQSNLYDQENLSKMLQLIYSTDDLNDYIELFHKIPEQLLRIYASDLVSEFEPVLKKYRDTIDEKISEYPYSSAETVARKMKIIYKTTNSAEIKTDAIVSVLFAANRLNRFAAMDEFDQMLRSINEDRDAYAVAEELRDQLYDYKRLYERIPKKELHPAIQIIWEACDRDA